jgi:uncharacterized short protein YbdD (DUF466 family)
MTIRERLSRAVVAVHRVLGAPDYDLYVAHVRERHPDVEPLDRTAFYHARLEAHYNRPGAKCC